MRVLNWAKAVLALTVFVLLMAGQNPWLFIAVYWAVVSVHRAVEAWNRRADNTDD